MMGLSRRSGAAIFLTAASVLAAGGASAGEEVWPIASRNEAEHGRVSPFGDFLLPAEAGAIARLLLPLPFFFCPLDCI